MKFALYARVSSDKQEREGTIESQLRALRQHTAERGYELEERHATMAGAKRIARGALLEELPHNAIYRSRSRE